jgi:DeoR/GlpR family transcriptional regulator of sugar metabolism
MIESADVVYLVADYSKIGKSSFASLGALSLIDYIITDSKIDQESIDLFSRHEIKMIIA